MDDGKSTLLGRLLLDAGAIDLDELAAARNALGPLPSRAADAGFDLSLLSDSLLKERAERITIDVAHHAFSTSRRVFRLLDAPGHQRYLQNMVTAASLADVALLVVDVTRGLTQQTRRHALLCSLLGVQHLMLCVTKMDSVEFNAAPFGRTQAAFREVVSALGLAKSEAIPLSGLHGDNVVSPSARMDWYAGPPLLSWLESVSLRQQGNQTALRCAIQHSVRAGGRVWYGARVSSGTLRVGDSVTVLPSGASTRVTWLGLGVRSLDSASPPASVTLTLAESPAAVRGDLLVGPTSHLQPFLRLTALLVWVAKPQSLPEILRIRHQTRCVLGRIEQVHASDDPNSPDLRLEPQVGHVARVTLALADPLFVDPYVRLREGGALLLSDPQTNEVLAAALVADPPAADCSAPRPGQVAWLTGLSGAGKTTIARELERRCHDVGRKCIVVDGDDMRRAVSRDLGFTPHDRRENVRRIAQVARLHSDGGALVVVACISPYAFDRRAASAAIGLDRFCEVHVATSLDVCRARDPKGLYARADRGEITDLTGVDAPYEDPPAPALRLDTAEVSAGEAATRLLKLVRAKASDADEVDGVARRDR